MCSCSTLPAAAARQRPCPSFTLAGRPRTRVSAILLNPPTVDEIIAIMRLARDAPYGNRLKGLIVVVWRAGLRINEALSLTETDLEQRRGSIWSGTARTMAAAWSGWMPGAGPRRDLGSRSARRCDRPVVLRARWTHARTRLVGQRRSP
jgi:integrase